MKKILVTGSNGYIGNALVLALLNRKKEFTVRAAARRGSILNSKSFETVRLGSLEESLDYVEAFKFRSSCRRLIWTRRAAATA